MKKSNTLLTGILSVAACAQPEKKQALSYNQRVTQREQNTINFQEAHTSGILDRFENKHLWTVIDASFVDNIQ